MNQARRTQIEVAKGQLQRILDQLQDIDVNTPKDKLTNILDEERDTFDNIPEPLKESERAQKASECVDTLDEVCDYLNDAGDAFDSLKEQLQNALDDLEQIE